MRTHLCGQITTVEIGHSVTLSGWVSSRRDHGGIIFIDLRDRSGRIQVVADPEMTASFVHLETVRNEFVLRVTGQVQARPEGTVNESSPTGEIEIVANQIDLLNQAKPLPFQLEEQEIGEQTRLKYRFLDLRRPAMQDLLRLRHTVISRLRAFLNEHEFIDIETPMLTRSTPEGARDYLVPSRTQLGAFFALPQSPQLFKQLLMVAGFERYYQIARCFRDEDLRADRQPEFTQLDVEMSFVDEFEVMNLMEEMVRYLFKSILNIDLVHPVPRMTYAEAVSRFGVDRPDLRIPLELTELTDVMREVEFKVFSGPAQDPSGRVVAMRIPDGNRLSRAQIDQYTEQVKQLGAKGLAYIKVHQISGAREGLHSPILKFLSDSVLDQILIRTRAEPGDLIVFGADKATIVNHAMGALRIQIGHDLELVDDGWELLWVTDFPLVEWSEENRRWQALHHPFTSPKPEHVDLLDNDPGRVLSKAYDLILNGTEIGGGSIRIHKDELQRKIFQVLGIGEREAAEKFGFLLEALNYGAPPHGGIAFGVDRLVAMMGGVESIRDVIAFPKTQKASCLLTEAPNRVSDLQLRDLGLQLKSA